MKLSEFLRTIEEMPSPNHSFLIKKENWFNQDQRYLIDNIFNKADTITLNRYDLLNSNQSLDEFVLKTLMWGYPIKGRGNNIDNLLEPDNFKLLIDILENYRDKNISASKLDSDIKSIKGLGLSTMSKFLCFLGARVENQETLILDRRIIEIIKAKTFDELKNLTIITYPTSAKNYVKYLETINNFSRENNTISQKVEMFIFIFGRHLSPLKGEEVYDFEEEYEKPIEKTYKDFIIESIETLSICEHNNFTNALNLVMSGELNEVNKVFEINDTYNFNMNHLTTSKDTNVQKIIKVIDCINQAIQSLKNLNNIQDEEINIE